jgi:hypothetical protein
MAILNKIKEIYDGWKNLFFPNPALKEMIDKRSNICDKCEHLSTKIYLHCDICNCYMPAKVRSVDSECPLNLWN